MSEQQVKELSDIIASKYEEVGQFAAENQRLKTHIRLLFKELEQSYDRNHGMAHVHFTEDGEFIEFGVCSLWVCRNRREKLAEWRITLTELGAKPEGEE